MSRYYSVLLLVSVCILVGIGLSMLTSTGPWVKNFEPHHFLTRQSIMAGIGLMFGIIAVRVDLNIFRRYAVGIFIITCIVLALCFVPGIADPHWGSNRWIKAPFVGQFQPSEPAKMVIIFMLATWFARWQTDIPTFWRGFVIPGVIAGIPMGLIAIETDVGSALSIAVAVAAVLFSVGTRLIYMVPAATVMIAGASYFIFNDPVRWGRIEAWLDLTNPVHQRGIGAQQWHSLLALGNGGAWGVGLGEGVEKLGTLTFAYSDFIFPVVGEELGLCATLPVVLCYIFIAVAGCGIALQADNIFNRILALGLTFIIVVPAMQNIAVATASLPNDGLPLPFVSYGGTSLIFSLVSIGILVGVHRRSTRSNDELDLAATKEIRLAARL